MDILEQTHGFDLGEQIKALCGGVNPFFRPIENYTGRRVHIDNREYIMTGSNDYLSLSLDPRVKAAAAQAVETYGTTCTGSRFLTGTRALHEQLEEELADFLGYGAVLSFPAGYLAPLATVSTLAGRRDRIYFDRENHACLIDGALISGSKIRKYRHNDCAHLRALLEKDSTTHPNAGKIIVTDSIFSMNGQMAPLAEIVALAAEFNCRVLVDDAHALGVLGDGGRGAKSHLGEAQGIDLAVGTFSKTLASVGGWVAGTTEAIQWLKYNARPFIFTAAPAPAQAGAALASVRIMREEPEHHARLLENTQYYLRHMKQAGFDTLGTQSPIVPVLIGSIARCVPIWTTLYKKGLFSTPAVPPAVPEGQSVIRTSINACHTRDDIDRIVEIFSEAAAEVGLFE